MTSRLIPSAHDAASTMRRAAVLGALVTLLANGPALAQTQDEPGQAGGVLGGLPNLAALLADWDLTFDALNDEEEGVYAFSGYVDLRQRNGNVRLQADSVRLDTDEMTFTAEGNVTFNQGEVLIHGSRMTGDLDGGTGEIVDAMGIGPDNIYFRGERITQLEPGVFRIERGVVTPCTQVLPIWEFGARTITLEPGDHATMTLPMFKVKGVPVLALPAIYWPISEDDRATGLLVPNIGTSSNRGFMISESFFWALGRSADATLTAERYSKAGTGLGAEFRHAFMEGSVGRVRFYTIDGTELTAEQIAAGQRSVPGGWSLDAAHVQELPAGFRLNANANFFTSQEFVQGFEDDFDRFLRRTSSAGVFLTGSWDAYTLNLIGDSQRTFFGQDSVLRQRLPEAEFRIRRKQLGGPLYVDFEGSAARLVRREQRADEETGGAYNRLDSFPELSLQFTQLPWLTFSPFVSWRSTYYSHRAVGDAFEPDPILRNSYETGIQVVGPSFFRIFDTPSSDYSPRFKHVLEPRLTWGRSDQLDFDGRVIRFDEIDRGPGTRNRMTLSLTSRLLAKRYPTPDAEERTVWETLSVELAREIDLDEPPDQEFPSIPLPYRLTARLWPSPNVNFSGSTEFSREFALGGYNVSGNLTYPRGQAGITWVRSVSTFPDEDDPTRVAIEGFNRLTGGGRVELFWDPVRRSGAVTVRGHTSWDITDREIQEIALSGQWNTQCCSIGGQFRNLSFSFRDEQQFSIILELAGVGSLGFGSDQNPNRR